MIMTVKTKISVKCSVCGFTTDYLAPDSKNSIESPDLDFRPVLVDEDSIDTWIEECPRCHYVAENVSDPCPVSPGYLRTESYLTGDHIEGLPKMALSFVRIALIQAMAEDFIHAESFMTEAAWICDDYDKENQARACRERSLNYLEAIDLSNFNKDLRIFYTIRKVDLLRRTRQFEEAINIAEHDISDLDQFNQSILDYEVALCKLHDDTAHSQDEACRA